MGCPSLKQRLNTRDNHHEKPFLPAIQFHDGGIYENVRFTATKPNEIANVKTSTLTLLIRFNAIFFEGYYSVEKLGKRQIFQCDVDRKLPVIMETKTKRVRLAERWSHEQNATGLVPVSNGCWSRASEA